MSKKDMTDKQIDFLIKQAFQYETNWIEANLEEVDFEKIPGPTRMGWREIVREVTDQRIRTEKRYRIGRLKSLVPFSTAAVMFLVLLVDGGMEALGGKPYTFDGNGVLYQESDNEVIQFNNQKILGWSQGEKIAYEKIAAGMSVDPLKLGYRPEGMLFHKYTFMGRSANLQFIYGNQFIYLDLNIANVNSFSAITVDGTLVDTVRNPFLNVDVDIYEEEVDGEIRFTAIIAKDSIYCVFGGVVSKEEFVKMVEFLQY